MIGDCDIKFVNKEITPFGGLSLFFKLLERCHFDEHLEQSGIPVQGSNRGYKPLQLILGLFAGVWCGASCFGHLDVVRYDTALCKLLGWERGADHRAYQRYFNKFSQAVNQRVFGGGCQRVQPQASRPPVTPSSSRLRLGYKNDSELLATPWKHSIKQQLPFLS